jgi:hypothetical protein
MEVNIAIWKSFTWKMFLENSTVLLTVYCMSRILQTVPGLNWGWTNLFGSQGGNLIVVPLLHGNSSIFLTIGKTLFFIGLICAQPSLTLTEEIFFRYGVTTQRTIIFKSVVFGISHCIMGISLGAAICLVGIGYFFATRYRNKLFAALDAGEEPDSANLKTLVQSTGYHTMFNTMALTILGLLILFNRI